MENNVLIDTSDKITIKIQYLDDLIIKQLDDQFLNKRIALKHSLRIEFPAEKSVCRYDCYVTLFQL